MKPQNAGGLNKEGVIKPDQNSTSDVNANTLMLFYHPLFQEITKKFLAAIFKQDWQNISIKFLQFVELNIRIQKVLVERFDFNKAILSALNDWGRELQLLGVTPREDKNAATFDFTFHLESLLEANMKCSVPQEQMIGMLLGMKDHVAFQFSEYSISIEVFQKFIFDIGCNWCKFYDIELFCFFINTVFLAITAGNTISESQMKLAQQTNFLSSPFFKEFEQMKKVYNRYIKKNLMDKFKVWCEWNFQRQTDICLSLVLKLSKIFPEDPRLKDYPVLFQDALDNFSKEVTASQAQQNGQSPESMEVKENDYFLQQNEEDSPKLDVNIKDSYLQGVGINSNMNHGQKGVAAIESDNKEREVTLKRETLKKGVIIRRRKSINLRALNNEQETSLQLKKAEREADKSNQTAFKCFQKLLYFKQEQFKKTQKTPNISFVVGLQQKPQPSLFQNTEIHPQSKSISVEKKKETEDTQQQIKEEMPLTKRVRQLKIQARRLLKNESEDDDNDNVVEKEETNLVKSTELFNHNEQQRQQQQYASYSGRLRLGIQQQAGNQFNKTSFSFNSSHRSSRSSALDNQIMLQQGIVSSSPSYSNIIHHLPNSQLPFRLKQRGRTASTSLYETPIRDATLSGTNCLVAYSSTCVTPALGSQQQQSIKENPDISISAQSQQTKQIRSTSFHGQVGLMNQTGMDFKTPLRNYQDYDLRNKLRNNNKGPYQTRSPMLSRESKKRGESVEDFNSRDNTILHQHPLKLKPEQLSYHKSSDLSPVLLSQTVNLEIQHQQLDVSKPQTPQDGKKTTTQNNQTHNNNSAQPQYTIQYRRLIRQSRYLWQKYLSENELLVANDFQKVLGLLNSLKSTKNSEQTKEICSHFKEAQFPTVELDGNYKNKLLFNQQPQIPEMIGTKFSNPPQKAANI